MTSRTVGFVGGGRITAIFLGALGRTRPGPRAGHGQRRERRRPDPVPEMRFPAITTTP